MGRPLVDALASYAAEIETTTPPKGTPMQIDTTATVDRLVAAYDATVAAIYALEAVDVSATADATVELLRDRRDLIAFELHQRGLRVCGRCRVAPSGAVDWGCTCGMTPDEAAAEAREFARIHD